MSSRVARRRTTALTRGGLLGLTPLLLIGCGRAPQNYVWDTGGPAASRIAGLGWQALIAFSAATLITWGLILWVALRRRGTLAEHEPIDVNQGQSWILIGGFAIPFAVLVFLFASMLGTLSAFPMEEHTHSQTPDIIVYGRQWWFGADYRFAGRPDLNVSTATELHIPTGRPISIQLQSQDVIHSFWVPKLHGKVDLVPGQQNYIRIEADKPGTFQGECAEYCGRQHAHMRLLVVAQSPQDYERWLSQQRAPSADPTGEEQAHGRTVFLSAACATCHTIRGTGANGLIGPDLTHIGSRKTIAGGMLTNNTAHLEAWVTNAQSLKPGAQMPNVSQFTGSDLRALVSYLQSLQ
jgi:cytochrome c oxidase subunit 2